MQIRVLIYTRHGFPISLLINYNYCRSFPTSTHTYIYSEIKQNVKKVITTSIFIVLFLLLLLLLLLHILSRFTSSSSSSYRHIIISFIPVLSSSASSAPGSNQNFSPITASSGHFNVVRSKTDTFGGGTRVSNIS